MDTYVYERTLQLIEAIRLYTTDHPGVLVALDGLEQAVKDAYETEEP